MPNFIARHLVATVITPDNPRTIAPGEMKVLAQRKSTKGRNA